MSEEDSSASSIGVGSDPDAVREMDTDLPDPDDVADEVMVKEMREQHVPEERVSPVDGEYVHTPVVGYQIINMYSLDERPMVQDRVLNWWSEDSITSRHPYLLINPVSIMDNLRRDKDQPAWHDTEGSGILENVRGHMDLTKGECYVIADSGGFQLMSQDHGEIVDRRADHDLKELKIHPESLVDWQVKNADAGAILDRPPFLSNEGEIEARSGMMEWAGESREADSQFNDCLDDTVEYTQRMWERLSELREMDEEGGIADTYEFTGVLHMQPVYREGWKETALAERWYTAMSEETDATFDAWSLTMKPVSIGALSFCTAVAEEFLKGETNYIHLLGAGSPVLEAFCSYASRETGLAITADSTNAHRGAKYRTFIFPHSPNIDMLSLVDSNGSPYGRVLEQYPCRCRVCDLFKKEYGTSVVNEESDDWGLTWLIMHDLQVRRSNAQQMRALIRSTPDLLEGLHSDIKGDDGFKNNRAGIRTTDNEFWKVMRNWYSDEKLIELWRGMDFVRIASNNGIDEAFRHYEIKNYFSNERKPSIVPRRGGVFQ